MYFLNKQNMVCDHFAAVAPAQQKIWTKILRFVLVNLGHYEMVCLLLIAYQFTQEGKVPW